MGLGHGRPTRSSLARRCTTAAREPADKIEDSIRKTENGVPLSAKVADGLKGIASKPRQGDALVAEIFTASGEQSVGIG